MRRTLLSTCVFFACGGEPIPIQAARLEPECFTRPEPDPDPPDLTAVERLRRTAERQMLEFRVSFAAQASFQLSKPVLEDPDASSWRIDGERGYLDGHVVARGDDWAALEMAIIGTSDDARALSIWADVHVTPAQTTYELNGSVLVARPTSFEVDEFARGCDPERGLSFEVTDRARCWPKPAIPADAGPEARAEFEASFDLQCAQMVESLRLGR
jgi:hypothetical protein